MVDPEDLGSVRTLARLLQDAGVVVHGFGPTAALLQVADGAARAAYDSRIWCSIDGFGARGPLANLPARDLLVAAHLGTAAAQVGWSPGPSYRVHHLSSVGAGLIAGQVASPMLMLGRNGCFTFSIEDPNTNKKQTPSALLT